MEAVGTWGELATGEIPPESQADTPRPAGLHILFSHPRFLLEHQF